MQLRIIITFPLLIIIEPKNVATSSKDSCESGILQNCLEMIQDISKDPNKAFPASEAMLDLVCKQIETGLVCASNYSVSCFSREQQAVLHRKVNGAVQVLGDLCSQGIFRESYLKLAPCLRKAFVNHDDRCSSFYHRLVNHSNLYQFSSNSLNNMNDQVENLKNVCCNYSEFVACSTTSIAADCGLEAAEFVAHYTRRAAGPLIHKHCSAFLDDRNNSCELPISSSFPASSISIISISITGLLISFSINFM